MASCHLQLEKPTSFDIGEVCQFYRIPSSIREFLGKRLFSTCKSWIETQSCLPSTRRYGARKVYTPSQMLWDAPSASRSSITQSSQSFRQINSFFLDPRNESRSVRDAWMHQVCSHLNKMCLRFWKQIQWRYQNDNQVSNVCPVVCQMNFECQAVVAFQAPSYAALCMPNSLC